jgi:hypothetical protein
LSLEEELTSSRYAFTIRAKRTSGPLWLNA